MRIAVLGVGLIGGSIGLAAKRRLGAEVVGLRRRARERARAASRSGRSTASAGRSPRRVEGAEIVFCAGPVGALPALVAEALDASGPDAVVTDVGSTKRELIAGLPADERLERFIGGHPIAGAESAGVENARDDLFEGARWYLTPTERSSGVHYDRLQRAIADLGARPQAIDPETHDRLMATVSHLPHVIANVLVQQAAAAAVEESERLPEVGPSFRDTTRVAGANPAIWGDIFATNSEAVAREIDAAAERLREAAEVIRSGDARPRRGLARRRSRGPPPAPGGGSGRRRALRAAAQRGEPARDRGRDRPCARPAGREHRGHGPLPGTRHADRSRLPLGGR